MKYYRPIVSETGHPLAGGWVRFDAVEVLSRDHGSALVAADDLPKDVLTRLTRERAPIADVPMNAPQVMGILNVTPDSFSDGGDYAAATQATGRALDMVQDGVSFVDIGGESTRPGATEVPVKDEIARVMPVIEGIRSQSQIALSLDTRKSDLVVQVSGGARFLINDVSAMTFDPQMAKVVAETGFPICLMHASGDPETMQDDPTYSDVVLDVYDYLAARIAAAVAAGIPRDQIVVDPGIGFGKTLEHNLALIRGLSLFHGLDCPILLGTSRKRFIGTIGNAPEPTDRLGGSLAVALEGVRQGVQILRVHDTYATKQAIDLHMAIGGTSAHGT